MTSSFFNPPNVHSITSVTNFFVKFLITGKTKSISDLKNSSKIPELLSRICFTFFIYRICFKWMPAANRRWSSYPMSPAFHPAKPRYPSDGERAASALGRSYVFFPGISSSDKLQQFINSSSENIRCKFSDLVRALLFPVSFIAIHRIPMLCSFSLFIFSGDKSVDFFFQLPSMAGNSYENCLIMESVIISLLFSPQITISCTAFTYLAFIWCVGLQVLAWQICVLRG